jgi:hypothetical protein
MLVQGGEPWVARLANALELGRASCDEAGVDRVVLGALQAVDGEGAHLPRLKQGDLEAGLAKGLGRRALIATRRFQADAGDALPGEPRDQLVTAGLRVGRAEARSAAMHLGIETGFADIDSSCNHVTMSHLRRSFLVDEPWVLATIRIRWRRRLRSC